MTLLIALLILATGSGLGAVLALILAHYRGDISADQCFVIFGLMMVLSYGAIIFLIILNTTPRALDGPLTIKNDPGGDLLAYMARARQPAPVRIMGTCSSACTMLLGAPDVCLSRQARLRFHGPSDFQGRPLYPVLHHAWAQRMASFYPGALGDWFMARAAHLRGAQFIQLRGAHLIDDHGFKEC